MPRTRHGAKKGGSLASDSVVAAVDPAAFPKMNAQFTSVLQDGGCGVCGAKHGRGCLCIGGAKAAKAAKAAVGAGWKTALKAKAIEAVDKLKKAKKPKATPPKSTKKTAKRGGGVADSAAPAYNYDGLLLETALTNSANNPGVATPMPFKDALAASQNQAGGTGLKKLSELESFEGYRLRNNKVGGSDKLVQLPVGISYGPAIMNSGLPVGYSPRSGLNMIASPYGSMTDSVTSTVPAPMAKTVTFGNNITDVAPPAFNYGAGTPQAAGGLVKKAIVAAVAYKAYKKYKANKKAKAAKAEAEAAAKSKASASAKKSSAKPKSAKKAA